jgi:hypothetical protein
MSRLSGQQSNDSRQISPTFAGGGTIHVDARTVIRVLTTLAATVTERFESRSSLLQTARESDPHGPAKQRVPDFANRWRRSYPMELSP